MNRLVKFLCDLTDCHGEEAVAERVEEVNQRHRELGHQLRDLRARTDALYRLVSSMRRPPNV